MLDFQDKNLQIELNKSRLKEEYERYYEIRSRIGILSIFYTILAAYSIQLIRFMLIEQNQTWYYLTAVIIYLILFVLSIYNAILLLMPKEIAFIRLPKYFYSDLYSEYELKPIKPEHIKYYLRETYQGQLEKAVEHNYLLNNKKSKYHYYAFTFALIALVPYFICVGIEVFNNSDDIIKVEIIKKTDKNQQSSINDQNYHGEKIMCENEDQTTNNNDNNSEEPAIDPDQVIQSEPEMIKENKDEEKKDSE